MAHSVLITVTLPTTRQDGSPVSPGSISEVDVLRSANGAAFTKVATITTGLDGATVSFTDTAVVGGSSYEYEAFCIDSQNVTGATSPAAGPVLVPLAALSAPSVSASLQ